MPPNSAIRFFTSNSRMVRIRKDGRDGARPSTRQIVSGFQNVVVTMQATAGGEDEPDSFETAFRYLKEQGLILDYQI
jgi:hypothetical protein